MKTLTIKDTVYNKLVKVKKTEESFSDLFERLADKEKTSILEFAGFLSEREAKKVENAITGYRKKTDKLDKLSDKRLDKLWLS